MWRDQISLRWNYHLLAAPGYVVLMTNYTGSSGLGEEFARDIRLNPFAGPASEINEAADQAIRRFSFIDGTRQIAAGASYGGHLVNWLQATTTRYRALVSHAGLVNLEVQWGTSNTDLTDASSQPGGHHGSRPAHGLSKIRSGALATSRRRSSSRPVKETFVCL